MKQTNQLKRDQVRRNPLTPQLDEFDIAAEREGAAMDRLAGGNVRRSQSRGETRRRLPLPPDANGSETNHGRGSVAGR